VAVLARKRLGHLAVHAGFATAKGELCPVGSRRECPCEMQRTIDKRPHTLATASAANVAGFFEGKTARIWRGFTRPARALKSRVYRHINSFVGVNFKFPDLMCLNRICTPVPSHILTPIDVRLDGG